MITAHYAEGTLNVLTSDDQAVHIKDIVSHNTGVTYTKSNADTTGSVVVNILGNNDEAIGFTDPALTRDGGDAPANPMSPRPVYRTVQELVEDFINAIKPFGVVNGALTLISEIGPYFVKAVIVDNKVTILTPVAVVYDDGFTGRFPTSTIQG